VLIVGVRGNREDMPRAMKVGNHLLTRLVHLLFRVDVSDTQSGYRAFTRKAYPQLRWISSNYAMETEMLLFAAKSGVPVKEVTISTVYHDNYKGTTALDGMRILFVMMKWRIIPRSWGMVAEQNN